MSDDPTIATSDRAAAAFAERTKDAPLEAEREAFARAVAGNAPPGMLRILDAGCGPGRDAAWFRRRGFRVVGADLSVGMLEVAVEQLIGVYTRVGPYGGMVVHMFATRVVGGELAPTAEALAHGWFERHELPRPELSPQHTQRIHDAFAFRTGALDAPVFRHQA